MSNLVAVFDQIFRKAQLGARLRPYEIMATSPTAGVIEVIPPPVMDNVTKLSVFVDPFMRVFSGFVESLIIFRFCRPIRGVIFQFCRTFFFGVLQTYLSIPYVLRLTHLRPLPQFETFCLC